MQNNLLCRKPPKNGRFGTVGRILVQADGVLIVFPSFMNPEHAIGMLKVRVFSNDGFTGGVYLPEAKCGASKKRDEDADTENNQPAPRVARLALNFCQSSLDFIDII
jgi:hypothetical protein